MNSCTCRLLAKRSDERYDTPEEVAQTLQPFTVGNDLPALVVRARESVAGAEVDRPNAQSTDLVIASVEHDTEPSYVAAEVGSSAARSDQTVDPDEITPTRTVIGSGGNSSYLGTQFSVGYTSRSAYAGSPPSGVPDRPFGKWYAPSHRFITQISGTNHYTLFRGRGDVIHFLEDSGSFTANVPGPL